MKKLEKLKKNFVINTKYLKDKDFNEPVYIIDSNKDFVQVFSIVKDKVKINKINLSEDLKEKTFITIKDFFRHCKIDNSVYGIEKVDNGDVYIRVAYLKDLSLFFRLRNEKNIFVLTNKNKYKFYKKNTNTLKALYLVNYLSEFDALKINDYLNNFKNIKRDYLYSLKKSLENLEKLFKQNNNKNIK